MDLICLITEDVEIFKCQGLGLFNVLYSVNVPLRVREERRGASGASSESLLVGKMA